MNTTTGAGLGYQIPGALVGARRLLSLSSWCHETLRTQMRFDNYGCPGGSVDFLQKGTRRSAPQALWAENRSTFRVLSEMDHSALTALHQ
ncbi:hypothetical protein NDU88_004084 [Pleurodeles waltl]|uniref:Uncharacterized protein n=1 Tax=Pleurodeles waltl TaxID=8319 RepID=A0AAV7NND2_PLEWA|nr:hypothetical protein NDU88_004084 [Pleurodeles waltl]